MASTHLLNQHTDSFPHPDNKTTPAKIKPKNSRKKDFTLSSTTNPCSLQKILFEKYDAGYAI
jgi:hypothetical protein